MVQYEGGGGFQLLQLSQQRKGVCRDPVPRLSFRLGWGGGGGQYKAGWVFSAAQALAQGAAAEGPPLSRPASPWADWIYHHLLRSCMDRLNRDMLVAAACCKVPKAAFWARLLGCKRWRRHELFRDWADVPQVGPWVQMLGGDGRSGCRERGWVYLILFSLPRTHLPSSPTPGE